MSAHSICVLLTFLIPFVQLLGPIENHYWKDFNGLIPHDAFQYYPYHYIGSAPFETGIFVGDLHNLTEKIDVVGYYADDTTIGVVMTRFDNIKILCTCNASALKWVPTTAYTFPSIPLQPVIGGFGNGSIYVGRFSSLDESVGRISNEEDVYWMYYVNGTKKVSSKVYDALIYDSEITC